MSDERLFEAQCKAEVKVQSTNHLLSKATRDWIGAAQAHKYSYHFRWCGLPIIQYPQDIVAMQELIWMVQPDLIIETGVARGGSLIFSASMLALLDLCNPEPLGIKTGPPATSRRVIGIDIDIREHNRDAIMAHPLANYITLVQGSSIDPEVVDQVALLANTAHKILVCLDSNHTHAHVLAELNAYAPMTTVGSYCVVFDTVIEDLPADVIGERPWHRGNSPKTAVWEFLGSHPEFESDKQIDNKLLISVAPDGYLRRTR